MGPTQSRPLALVPRDSPPLEQRSDDELMQLARLGLNPAFAILVGRYQGPLRGYCARICGGAGDDVAQEVFVTVWSLRDAYDPRGQFRAYLFRLAENRCRNALRSRVRSQRKHTAAEQVEQPPDPNQLDGLLTRERQGRLDELVEKLPEEQRRAIQLRYAAGLEYEEIAEIVERPEATVRTRVFLGLKRLRKLVPARGEP